MKEIIKKLKRSGLLNNQGPKTSAIQSLSMLKIADLAIDIENTIRKSYQSARSPIFSHAASLNLGGGTIECGEIGCRLSRVRKLARFASLYCDEVFIASFFAGYKDPDDWKDLEFAQRELFNDLILIHELAPLINDGLVKFYSPRTNVCFSCQARQFLDKNAGKKFSLQYRKLKKQYLDNLTVNCELADDQYTFELDCPSPFLDHPLYLQGDAPPYPIVKRRTILNRINSGIRVNASKTLTKELDFHTDLAHSVATNAILGLVTSGTLQTSFLTENDIHISFLNSLHKENMARQKNLIALNHLSSIVPFVEDVPMKDLLKLRRREKEAFISYRKALNVAIDNFGGIADTFTERDAKELHADVINPKLVDLERKVKAAKRDLIKKPFRSLSSVVGVISFGLLTGLITPDIAAIAKTIGLVKFGSDTIMQTMALGDKEDAIKSDHFYFLWKLKQRGR